MRSQSSNIADNKEWHPSMNFAPPYLGTGWLEAVHIHSTLFNFPVYQPQTVPGLHEDRLLPLHFHRSVTISHKKPNKKSYSIFKVYRPIAILRIIRKALESVLVNRLAWAAEIHALLPNLHLGSRRDAIMYLSFGCWLLIGSTKRYPMDLIHVSDITSQGDIYFA